MTDTFYNEFLNDPDVIRAKNELLRLFAQFQKKLTGIVPPDPDLKISYLETISEFNRERGGNLFFNYLGSGMGSGPFVELADGSVKYDFISGIGVHHLGHGRPEVVRACLDAALSDVVMQGNLQQNTQSTKTAKLLLDAANKFGAGFEHCFFSTSGAMANENALKLIFQKRHPADRILAFAGCFAGRTLALAQITDKEAYRIGLPSTLSVDYVPFYDANRPAESCKAALDRLTGYLDRYPGRYACMMFELVQGEGGFYPGTREFFAPLMDLLQEHQTAIFIDEIQTFSRLPELFAYQYFGLDGYPDVVTVAKAAQVSATLFTGEYNPQPGLLSQTFTSATSALYACEAILKNLLSGDYFGPNGRIVRFHDRFVEKLESISKKYPDLIGGPYGIGAMVAFTAFGGDLDKVKRFLQALFYNGVLAFYAGHNPTRVRFLPPIGAITEADIDNVCELVERTLVEVAAK
jgi:4-aminobutyrate aminotransferase-like enzyme